MPTLREIQLFELQMLKDVVKVCDDNNITYFHQVLCLEL